MKQILNNSFYHKKTLFVAQDLLGKFLMRKIGRRTICAMITETEAYCGPYDLASHASRGRTPRTEIMFGPPGHAYIYLVWVMYYCFNIATKKKNYPAAVLIRAVKIHNVDYDKTNGPGKLCKFLKIDKKLNGIDITKRTMLWVEESGVNIKPSHILKTFRIGVDYAREYKDKKWRFIFTFV